MIIVDLPSLQPVAPAWYGPATVEFAVSAPGNPYDSTENDLRVRFHPKSGADVERLAYYQDGRWKAVLVANRPGEYEATLIRNGVATKAKKTISVTAKLNRPFVRLGGKTGFEYETGKPYWPLGHNLGWSDNDIPDIPKYISTMPENGMNWSRIWACYWDGKNPWFPVTGKKIEIGMFTEDAFKKWDDITAASDKAGVYFQMVLFHHGPFSSRVNTNWPENPWNVKNGGFLATPTEFFTSPKAMKLTKDYVRYMIARYGHRPSVLSWELWNEVEWVDPNYEGKQALIGAWHTEMYDFVRKLDPYHHMVTSSSGMELPIYAGADYYQPHGYPASVRSMITGFKKPTDKPVFYGEIGPSGLGDGRPVQVKAIRDGIYTSLLMGHAGAAEFWTWNEVAKKKLQPEFKIASAVVSSSGILNEVGLKPFTPGFEAPMDGDLVMVPGRGWAKTDRFEFNLPADADRGMGEVSSYLHGTAHADMRLRPLTFKFNAATDTTALVKLGQASRSGAHLVIKMDGRVVKDEVWPAASADQGKSQTVTIPLNKGAHTMVIDNTGPDWVQMNEIRIGGIGPSVMGDATGNRRFAMLRVQRLAARSVATPLLGLPLADGKYSCSVRDLDSGAVTRSSVTVRGGRTVERLSLGGDDLIVTLGR